MLPLDQFDRQIEQLAELSRLLNEKTLPPPMPRAFRIFSRISLTMAILIAGWLIFGIQ